MKYASVLGSASFLSVVLGAYVPSQTWSTLTPAGSIPSGASTDHAHKFGIQIKTISAASSASASATTTAAAKRAVNQIGDGQIQEQTSETLSTVTKSKTTASVVNQIGDGQIQHQTATTSSSTTTAATTASVVNQIGDGQIQHQTASTSTATTASVVNQITDGQIQNQTASQSATQATDSASTDSADDSDDDSDDDGLPEACLTDSSLSMTLNKTILTDAKGRVGAIVSNRQFQFDGPPPQAGSIYAAGWSITTDGLLALGNQTTFYQCASGDFYNLYDENVAAQCAAVELGVIDLVSC